MCRFTSWSGKVLLSPCLVFDVFMGGKQSPGYSSDPYEDFFGISDHITESFLNYVLQVSFFFSQSHVRNFTVLKGFLLCMSEHVSGKL